MTGPTAGAASLVQPCDDLDATVGFFSDRLGFRLETIFPADAPTVAIINGHGLRIRLDRGSDAPAAVLRLPPQALPATGEALTEIIAPNVTRILVADGEIPDFADPVRPDLVIRRADADRADWNAGRAGMRYRDLLPGRWNGHVVASHIRIPEGGPIPDYVHYHDVRFQMIYCHRGWVRVVYQDQGEPFVMRPGDCVLQPPGIRHRVLEASDALEVIEIGCPALHATHADHALGLPSPQPNLGQSYGGQRFVRHEAATARWEPGPSPGFETRDLGIGAATDGLARVAVHRAGAAGISGALVDGDGFRFLFVLSGGIALSLSEESWELDAGDAATVPPESSLNIASRAGGTEILSVVLSGSVFSP
jgi:quercetin dioxygenase-like cupin family protein